MPVAMPPNFYEKYKFFIKVMLIYEDIQKVQFDPL